MKPEPTDDPSPTEYPEPRLVPDDSDSPQRRFHGWRLLGAIFIVVVVLAVVSAIVDWAVIGPLEGRI
ncbi:MAG: hypothetical protein AAF515_16830 [Pseudomonadota bacterium]